jgi:sugar lactone lactonase YvrE
MKNLILLCLSQSPQNGSSTAAAGRFLVPAVRLRHISTWLAGLCVLASGFTPGLVLHAQPPVSFHGTVAFIADPDMNGIQSPYGLAVDKNGSVYISDPANKRVLRLTPSGSGYAQTVIADHAKNGLTYPVGLAVDSAGGLYIADAGNNAVYLEEPSNGRYTQVVVAGPSNGLSGSRGVAVDAKRNVIIADTGNNRIVAEARGTSGYTQAVAIGPAYGLSSPNDVAVDASENLYVADTGNNRVLKETLGSTAKYTQSVIANSASNGINHPDALVVDQDGYVFVADTNSDRVLKESPGSSGYSQSVVDGAVEAYCVAVDSHGLVYVGDGFNKMVLKETLFSGPVDFGAVSIGSIQPVLLVFEFNTSVTLSSTKPYQAFTMGSEGRDFWLYSSEECIGNFQFKAGETCWLDTYFQPMYAGPRLGAVFLYDTNNNPVATAYVHGSGQAPQAAFAPATQSVLVTNAANGVIAPRGIAVDGSGDLYVCDTAQNEVLKETLSGGTYTQSVLFDSAHNGLLTPEALALDGGGSLYIADTGNSRILKETPSGNGYIQSAIADSANNGISQPVSVAVDLGGNVYIADFAKDEVLKLALTDGAYLQSMIAGVGTLAAPRSVAVDSAGNVYIGDSNTQQVLKETYSGGSYTSTVVANASQNGINQVVALAVDGNGNVYLSDSFNNRVLKETVSGTTYVQSVIADASSGTKNPWALAVEARGNVFITDLGAGNKVLKEDITHPPSMDFGPMPWGTISDPQATQLENIGNAVLNAVAPGLGIPAGFAQSVGPGTPPDCTATFSLAAGDACNLSVVFVPTPADIGNVSAELVITDNDLNAKSATQSISLSGVGLKVLPEISWPAPAAITYGTPLSATQLDATANVPGSLAYSPALGTVLKAGTQILCVTFTPTDTNEYKTAAASVNLTVNPATPTITWLAPAPIVYGTPLSATQLNATANTAGTFAYSPDRGTVLGAGPHTLGAIFTPGDTKDYTSATANVTLVVKKAMPTIKWATPAAIIYGTALSPKQLDATASVAGSLVYKPGAGTVLGAGVKTLSVIFTPSDNADYLSATVTVPITVLQATLQVSADNKSRVYGAPNPQFTYKITGFVHGDTRATSVKGDPKLVTTAKVKSSVGSYPIEIFQGSLRSTNYQFKFKNGVLKVTYAGTTATPTIKPPTETFKGAVTVTMSDATKGATIYYALHGATPGTWSTPYKGSFKVNSTTTVKAIAVAQGYHPSAIATVKYTMTQ